MILSTRPWISWSPWVINEFSFQTSVARQEESLLESSSILSMIVVNLFDPWMTPFIMSGSLAGALVCLESFMVFDVFVDLNALNLYNDKKNKKQASTFKAFFMHVCCSLSRITFKV